MKKRGVSILLLGIAIVLTMGFQCGGPPPPPL
jgi:hypothetical protein